MAHIHARNVTTGTSPSVNDRMVDQSALADSLLPLPSAAFHILLSLAAGDRHGYAIIQDVAGRSDGSLKLSAGTLYRSIHRMLDQNLITEVRERPDAESDDERRRYYRISPLGRAVIQAETSRLAQLLKLARTYGIVPGPP